MAAFFRVNHEMLSLQNTKHVAGTPGAAKWARGIVNYVGRDKARNGQAECSAFLSGVPGASTRREVASWMSEEMNTNERANGRIGERIIASFPKDFTQEQCVAAVKKYAALVTGDNAIPWFAGIHNRGKDAENPHAHIVFRDRYSADERRRAKEQNKRIVKGQNKLGWLNKMATKNAVGSTETFRQFWAHALNEILAEDIFSTRVDHRSAQRQSDNAQRTKVKLSERAERDLKTRKIKDESIAGHAKARLAAEVEAGKIDQPEMDAKLAKIEADLGAKTAASDARWQASIAKIEAARAAEAAAAAPAPPPRPAPVVAKSPAQVPTTPQLAPQPQAAASNVVRATLREIWRHLRT